MAMEKVMVIQGRKITPADINLIKKLLADHPSWNRTKLSRELCKEWQWLRPDGQQLKDMACRTLLLKLERTGCIKLPPRQGLSVNGFRKHSSTLLPHSTENICCSLKMLLPLKIAQVTPKSDDHPLFNCLLSHYHYLGHRTTVGENMKYLVRDCDNRPLACLLFGSAAWKTAPRDTFIGWDRLKREATISCLTNHMRFLLLPWVKVPPLASHILSLISRRICNDWTTKYNHPIHLLETFVDRTRFL
ncbi:MAG: DUF4338 domain-containing protein, partial [Deltaproteobacteria bacterium]|nr:DUF4338 domain-containing protein [Deltaproteobacteria bacterium]